MKALWRGGGAYGLGNALTAGAQFTAILIFAGALPTGEFGRLSIYSVLFIVMSMTTGLGLSASIQHAFFQIAEDRFRLLVSSILKAVFAFATLLAVIVLAVPDSLIVYSSLPREWVLYALAAATSQVFAQAFFTILQTQERFAAFLAMVGLQIVIYLGSALFFLLAAQKQWQSAVLAQSASPIVAGLVSLLLLARSGYFTTAFSMQSLRGALRYSLPLVPHQLASWVISMVDRFIIASVLGVAAAGVYSLSFQIAQATNIVSNSFNQALVPILFRLLADPEPDREQIRRINRIYAVGLCGFSAVFTLVFLVVAPWFLRSDYRPARSYTPWLIVAFLMLAVSRVASNFLMYYGRTGILAASTMASAVCSVSINLLLIPKYGTIAACWSSVVSFTFLLGITTWQARSCVTRHSPPAAHR